MGWLEAVQIGGEAVAECWVMGRLEFTLPDGKAANMEYVVIELLLLLFKKVSSARLGERDIHPISPKTPAPQYQPIDRKKRKGKRVEDYSRDRAA